MTSAVCASLPSTDPSELVPSAAQFLALVEKTRAAVQAALAVDAAACAHRDDAGHAERSEDVDGTSGTDGATASQTWLERLVTGLLDDGTVAWATVKVVG